MKLIFLVFFRASDKTRPIVAILMEKAIIGGAPSVEISMNCDSDCVGSPAAKGDSAAVGNNVGPHLHISGIDCPLTRHNFARESLSPQAQSYRRTSAATYALFNSA